ncbi:DUF2634 domain-containing protein [Mycobacteroides abscessus]|uniref:DUF2634 domain-containing protein n=1 Tax=unclassified Desemzia TaxID=2685243 RepID=UPI0009A7DA24|nr:Protein of uncharacterised function (DUF2634) [Mycobacteroides abscessus subsp. abscessus]
MIPGTDSALQEDLEFEQLPSLDYRMYFENQKIIGMVDGIDAVKQAIFMVLNTERYEHVIYSWDYGIELKDLYGEPVTYACPEVERRVSEALMMDERVLEVHTFDFDNSQKGKIQVTFIADTIFGNLENEMVVNI